MKSNIAEKGHHEWNMWGGALIFYVGRETTVCTVRLYLED